MYSALMPMFLWWLEKAFASMGAKWIVVAKCNIVDDMHSHWHSKLVGSNTD